jgi:sarcosine oxidase gamma subunit
MPEEAIEERKRVRERYLEALRDWAHRGADSRHLPDSAALAARMKPADPAIAEAHARFRLGRHLVRQGREQEAQAQFAMAVRLHPDSWNIWRQTAGKDERGLASGEAFWARVDALGDRPYYAPVDAGDAPGRG